MNSVNPTSPDIQDSPEMMYEKAMIRPVADFTSNYGGGYAHDYPGERPRTNFLLDGENALGDHEPMVYPIHATLAESGELTVEVKLQDERVNLDDILLGVGQPGINDRIPIVAYGANVCPKAMARKFHLEHNKQAGIVPTLYAEMPGYEVVWHEKPGQMGGGIAVLYKGEETRDADVEVAVNFLTTEQLLLLHRSENNYDLGYVGTVTLVGQHEIPALIYAGNDSIIIKDGRPVAVEGVRRKTSVLEAMPSEEVVDYMLSTSGVREGLEELDPRFATANARVFAEVMRSLELRQKKEVQQVVRAHTEKASVSMADPAYSGLKVLSWANPNTIPTYRELLQPNNQQKPLLLPEQIIHNATAEERQAIREKISRHFRDIIRPKL